MAKNESNELIMLRKEISDLRDTKMGLENKLALMETTAAVVAATKSHNNSLRSSDDLTTPLMNQNQSLTNKVRELENRIDELDKDRRHLSACKTELSLKLEENETEIAKQNEALHMAALQYNVDKKSLNDELQKTKRELNVLTDLKKSLIVCVSFK